MSNVELEQILANLPQVGTLVKDRPCRQVWRFEHAGRGYYLKFYRRIGWRWRLGRLAGGSPALAEFLRFQWLQKAGIPSPRASAVLMGFRLNGEVGDAVIVEAVEPSLPLDQYLQELDLSGDSPPARRDLVRQVIEIIRQLGLARLGHNELRLGSFLLSNGKVFLADAASIRKGGLKVRDVQGLAYSADAYLNRTDILRAWKVIGDGADLPRRNPAAAARRRAALRRVFREDRRFGRLRLGRWSGHFVKHWPTPHWWATGSQFTVSREAWEQAWPQALAQIDSGQWTALKRDASGEVLEGEIILDGRPLTVVAKRPRRRRWWRYINEIFRGSRARRAWKKAWSLVVRDIPTAWPLLLMERRRFGYVTDAILVCERIAGRTLADIDLDAMPPQRRDLLLRRVGRLLRRLERSGVYLYDAKATNWMIHEDDLRGRGRGRGPVPMLIDVDGLRPFAVAGGNFPRLLRSVRGHPQFRPEDEASLRLGYEPYEKSESSHSA